MTGRPVWIYAVTHETNIDLYHQISGILKNDELSDNSLRTRFQYALPDGIIVIQNKRTADIRLIPIRLNLVSAKLPAVLSVIAKAAGKDTRTVSDPAAVIPGYKLSMKSMAMFRLSSSISMSCMESGRGREAISLSFISAVGASPACIICMALAKPLASA